jgi:hypothetical protein
MMGTKRPAIGRKEVNKMVKCGICGGKAPKQPCITEEGKCDICGKKVVLTEEKKK